MENQRTIKPCDLVGGILLGELMKLGRPKDQSIPAFVEKAEKLIKDLLPNFHYVICDNDCWDSSLLEDIWVRHVAWVEKKHYLVAVFQKGKLFCNDRKKSVVKRSEGGVAQEVGKFESITFNQNPNLKFDEEFEQAYGKLKSTMKNFDKLVKHMETELALEEMNPHNGIEAKFTEKGVEYVINPIKPKKQKK